MHAAPVYISETAPASVRGLLVSLKEGFIVLGILSGFLSTALVTSTWHIDAELAWRLIWLPPCVPAAVCAVGMLSMPESPRWFVLRPVEAASDSSKTTDPYHYHPKFPEVTSGAARHAKQSLSDALHALRRLRSRSLSRLDCDERAVQEELDAIQETLGAQNGAAVGGCAEVLSARRALVAGLGLVLLQQVTGQPSVLYYQEAIFTDAVRLEHTPSVPARLADRQIACSR